MIGNNVAAFSLDLTPDGATFMEQTLVGRDGRGATDLTPIQVVYELTMLAKLPPATMYIKFNTASLYHAVQELFHEHTNCSDDYFTSENMMTHGDRGRPGHRSRSTRAASPTKTSCRC